MNWLLRLIGLRRHPRRATLVMTLKTGTKIDTGTVVCPRCTNYFFAAHMEMELPTFCPYCGLRFEGFYRDEKAIDDLIV